MTPGSLSPAGAGMATIKPNEQVPPGHRRVLAALLPEPIEQLDRIRLNAAGLGHAMPIGDNSP